MSELHIKGCLNKYLSAGLLLSFYMIAIAQSKQQVIPGSKIVPQPINYIFSNNATFFNKTSVKIAFLLHSISLFISCTTSNAFLTNREGLLFLHAKYIQFWGWVR